MAREITFESHYISVTFKEDAGKVFIVTEDDEHSHTLQLLPIDVEELQSFIASLD